MWIYSLKSKECNMLQKHGDGTFHGMSDIKGDIRKTKFGESRLVQVG